MEKLSLGVEGAHISRHTAGGYVITAGRQSCHGYQAGRISIS